EVDVSSLDTGTIMNQRVNESSSPSSCMREQKSLEATDRTKIATCPLNMRSLYIKNLEEIDDHEQGNRREMTRLLLDPRPDYKQSRDWEEKRSKEIS
ncbi:10326_t:CDS:2, partial [Funneliformis geosporum]